MAEHRQQLRAELLPPVLGRLPPVLGCVFRSYYLVIYLPSKLLW